jgi:DNA polymerase III subunit gamma/tau
MSQVLYRKHRSQTFDQLVGQEHIATILKNAVAQGQVAHAYLFYGPRGLGKTSTARILAKAVNCLQLKPDGNPCNECEACVAIREGKFLDLIEIDAASNRGIDQIRELKERIEFSPSEGKKKVYIIDEVHMLTTEAFNALLKTLEEPPDHAIFILATTEIHKVPATILSRCQRFDFRLGTDADVNLLISSVLKEENITIDDEAMDLIIENARGSYRDALSLLDVIVSGQEKGDDPKHITEEEVRVVLGLADSTMAYFFLEKLVKGESGEALDLIDELSQKGVNFGQFVTYVLSVLREILVSGLRGKVDIEEYSFAASLDRSKTLKLINLFVDAERSLKDALVPTLPLEILVADAMEIFGDGEGSDGGKSGKTEGDDGSGDDRKNTTGNNSGEKRPKVGTKSKKISSTDKKTSRKKDPDAGSLKKKGEDTPPIAEAKPQNDGTNTAGGDGLSLDGSKLAAHWEDVVKELRKYNSHLYAFIGRAQVLGLENGVLTLAVGFDFHKDRIESPKSRDAISEVFKKVFGEPVKLECILDDSIRSSVKPAAEVIVMEQEVEKAPVDVAAKARNIYDSVSEVFGDELVGM